MQLAENDAAYLHTLGCVYAELGKTKEARDVLLQAMETRHLIQPDENYWYAFGRIAEQYGESDIALADYRKVSVPVDKSKIWYSTYQLAQNRIALLKTPSAAAGKTTH